MSKAMRLLTPKTSQRPHVKALPFTDSMDDILVEHYPFYPLTTAYNSIEFPLNLCHSSTQHHVSHNSTNSSSTDRMLSRTQPLNHYTSKLTQDFGFSPHTRFSEEFSLTIFHSIGTHLTSDGLVLHRFIFILHC